jgi:hypothetical protein
MPGFLLVSITWRPQRDVAVPTIDRIAQWAQDKARARLKVLAEESDKK